MTESEAKPYRIIKGQRVQQDWKDLARTLRKDMTPAEQAIWQGLRGSQLGFRFRRQQIIGGFIADFYCHQAGLVVEIDGSTHDKEYDSERDTVFGAKGIIVLRFTNNEAIHQTQQVLERICQELHVIPNLTPPAPSPKRRGGVEPASSGEQGLAR